jgi:mannose-6-phosphate isomerase-like protein (cupin superfamily)
MEEPIRPLEEAARLAELWSPRVIGEVDDSYVKVARVRGTLCWHVHDDEDELFFVLRGRLKIAMQDRSVELGPGDLYVVPRGVRHNPVADEECLLMLIERKSTLHTGGTVTERTRSIEEQLRPRSEPGPR